MKKIYIAPKMEQQKVNCMNMIAATGEIQGGGNINGSTPTYGDAKSRTGQDEASWNALW